MYRALYQITRQMRAATHDNLETAQCQQTITASWYTDPCTDGAALVLTAQNLDIEKDASRGGSEP